MYKVFFNKKPIFLINKLVMPKKDMPIIFIKFVSKDKIIKAIKSKKLKLYIYTTLMIKSCGIIYLKCFL